jgi:hypothetical protein
VISKGYSEKLVVSYWQSRILEGDARPRPAADLAAVGLLQQRAQRRAVTAADQRFDPSPRPLFLAIAEHVIFLHASFFVRCSLYKVEQPPGLTTKHRLASFSVVDGYLLQGGAIGRLDARRHGHAQLADVERGPQLVHRIPARRTLQHLAASI